MGNTTEKQEVMQDNVGLIKNAEVSQEVAKAALSGFFAGIMSREAITTEKSA